MRPVLLLTFVLVATAAAAQVYKWVDSAGGVNYSDRPVGGAQALGIPLNKAGPPVQMPGPGLGSPGPYEQFEILSPEADATLSHAGGEVQVGLLLRPPLFDGHGLRIVADGAPVAGERLGTQLRIQGLSFGSHQLQAQVLDAGGATVASTPMVHFHIRRPDNP